MNSIDVDERIKQELIRRGYRVEVVNGGTRELVYRPDGTVAITATKGHVPDILASLGMQHIK